MNTDHCEQSEAILNFLLTITGFPLQSGLEIGFSFIFDFSLKRIIFEIT